MTQMEEKPEDRSWYYANKSAFLSVLLTMEAQAYFIPEEFIRYRAKIDGVIR
jgi:hypothetical protein